MLVDIFKNHQFVSCHPASHQTLDIRILREKMNDFNIHGWKLEKYCCLLVNCESVTTLATLNADPNKQITFDFLTKTNPNLVNKHPLSFHQRLGIREFDFLFFLLFSDLETHDNDKS